MFVVVVKIFIYDYIYGNMLKSRRNVAYLRIYKRDMFIVCILILFIVVEVAKDG